MTALLSRISTSGIHAAQEDHAIDHRDLRCRIWWHTTSDTSIAESCHHVVTTCPSRALPAIANLTSNFESRRYLMASQPASKLSSWHFHHQGTGRQTRSSFSPVGSLIPSRGIYWQEFATTRAKTPVVGSEEASARASKVIHAALHFCACAGAAHIEHRLPESPDPANPTSEYLRCASAASSHVSELSTERGQRVVL